ncbi:MAG: hypothetical protein MZW92_66240 [Comamonadaceae bacterium]|nr:hypothetical protein [Comamonadaceae bacterium]
MDAYERCNLWLLYTALACGPGQGALRLPVERRRRRRARRHARTCTTRSSGAPGG